MAAPKKPACSAAFRAFEKRMKAINSTLKEKGPQLCKEDRYRVHHIKEAYEEVTEAINRLLHYEQDLRALEFEIGHIGAPSFGRDK